MAAKAQPFEENGVTISKSTIYAGDEITVTYSGMLASNGAVEIYAHVGYGDEWEQKSFIPMANNNGVFSCNLNVLMPGTLNMCFKDNADNWDNNSQNNYSFKVAKKAVRATKTNAGITTDAVMPVAAKTTATKPTSAKTTAAKPSTAKTTAKVKAEKPTEPKKATAKTARKKKEE